MWMRMRMRMGERDIAARPTRTHTHTHTHSHTHTHTHRERERERERETRFYGRKSGERYRPVLTKQNSSLGKRKRFEHAFPLSKRCALTRFYCGKETKRGCTEPPLGALFSSSSSSSSSRIASKKSSSTTYSTKGSFVLKTFAGVFTVTTGALSCGPGCWCPCRAFPAESFANTRDHTDCGRNNGRRRRGRTSTMR